jgi:hypothetical protein
LLTNEKLYAHAGDHDANRRAIATIVVEPLELPIGDPKAEPCANPIPTPDVEPEQVPASQ